MLKRVLPLGILIAGGCVTVGDNGLVVEGHLTATDTRELKCNLEVARPGDPLPTPDYYVRAIGADFSESFSIEPAIRRYRVAITCPGYETIERIVWAISGLTRVEVGTVALRPNK
jgi:hypothetical protein